MPPCPAPPCPQAVSGGASSRPPLKLPPEELKVITASGLIPRWNRGHPSRGALWSPADPRPSEPLCARCPSSQREGASDANATSESLAPGALLLCPVLSLGTGEQADSRSGRLL